MGKVTIGMWIRLGWSKLLFAMSRLTHTLSKFFLKRSVHHYTILREKMN